MPYSIAIDIGGTTIKYAIVSREGDILFESQAPTRSNKPNLVHRLKSIIREMLDIAAVQTAAIIGIGIGVPSVVDNGTILYANNLPELDNLPLDILLKEEFSLPVIVESDAWLMGLGESRWGAARGVSEAVLLTIGTGIGGALILNGRLYKGFRNRNTEPGYMIIDSGPAAPVVPAVQPTVASATPTDPTATNPAAATLQSVVPSTPHPGTLEAKASVPALINHYQSLFTDTPLPADNIDARYIINRYHQNDPHAITALNAHWHFLATGIAGLINVFAPQKCIIGGGISEAGDFYLENLAARIFTMTLKETSQFTTIELAALGNKAGFLGAAALAIDRFAPA